MSTSDRPYNYSIVCYNLVELQRYVSLRHVKYYAYILHDKDIREDGTPKEPHYHLSVTYRNGRSVSAVYKELKNFFSSTVLVEVTEDLSSILDYLVHARDPTKFQYDSKDVVSTYIGDNQYADNTALSIINDIIDDIPYRQLVVKYGRDLVINYSRYKSFADLIIQQEFNDSYIVKTTGQVLDKFDFSHKQIKINNNL